MSIFIFNYLLAKSFWKGIEANEFWRCSKVSYYQTGNDNDKKSNKLIFLWRFSKETDILANLSLLMATVCDMVKLQLGIATTMLQQLFQHLMTPLCTNSRLKLLRILFYSKVAMYSLCTTNMHRHFYWKTSSPNIVGYLQHYYSYPTNLTFSLVLFSC